MSPCGSSLVCAGAIIKACNWTGFEGMQCPVHPLVPLPDALETRVCCVYRAPDLSASDGRDATATKGNRAWYGTTSLFFPVRGSISVRSLLSIFRTILKSHEKLWDNSNGHDRLASLACSL